MEIDASNAVAYLRQSARLAPSEDATVAELTGGVSNVVLLVERQQAGGGELPARFILKQARPRLRVAREWLCSVERNWREVDVLSACGAALTEPSLGEPTITVPKLLFADRENYLFAMTAAPRERVVWKERLLAGDADPLIAAACGRLLGGLHSRTWRDSSLGQQLGDRQLFDALRVDPYYRATAEVHADMRPAFADLLRSIEANPVCLVHADFSPKNLLLYDEDGRPALMLVDFETGHFGDPAFDLGFFLSHLVLKAVYHAPNSAPLLRLVDEFWLAYERAMFSVPREEYLALAARSLLHLAGCALARLDGKSPVDYFHDEQRRKQVRTLCRRLFDERPANWSAARAALLVDMPSTWAGE